MASNVNKVEKHVLIFVKRVVRWLWNGAAISSGKWKRSIVEDDTLLSSAAAGVIAAGGVVYSCCVQRAVSAAITKNRTCAVSLARAMEELSYCDRGNGGYFAVHGEETSPTPASDMATWSKCSLDPTGTFAVYTAGLMITTEASGHGIYRIRHWRQWDTWRRAMMLPARWIFKIF